MIYHVETRDREPMQSVLPPGNLTDFPAVKDAVHLPIENAVDQGLPLSEAAFLLPVDLPKKLLLEPLSLNKGRDQTHCTTAALNKRSKCVILKKYILRGCTHTWTGVRKSPWKLQEPVANQIGYSTIGNCLSIC